MSNIQVAVRVRPLSKAEVEHNASIIVRMKGEVVEIVKSSAGPSHRGTFDHAFWSCNTFVPGNRNENASQEEIYNKIGEPCVNNTFDGYNSCLFAYGQTGSGKTYTMMGEAHDDGVAVRMGHDIFTRVKRSEKEGKEVSVEVSFLEIYNENVRDLLNPDPKGYDGKKLRVREHPKAGTFVDGLSSFTITSQRELLELLQDGQKMRTTGSTLMNISSSRSHAVMMITVKQTTKNGALVTTRRSQMNIVDLAGSERAEKTGAAGDRFKEGTNINKSLSTLGLVISHLADGKHSHIPYRDSVLTWILKDNLGGNSKTTMIACISPASAQYEETVSTLRYAESAKKIVNKAVVNDINNSEVIAALQKEIAELKDKLNATAPGTKDKQEVKEEIDLAASVCDDFALTFNEKRDKTKQLMLERDKNIEELRRKLEEQSGELSNLKAQSRAKDAKIQELLNRIQTLSGGNDESAVEKIREEIAKLEQDTPAVAPKAKKQDDLNDLNEEAVAMTSDSVLPAAAAAAAHTGDEAAADEGEDMDMDDIDMDDFEIDEAELAAADGEAEGEDAGGEEDMDNIEIDDAELEEAANQEEGQQQEAAAPQEKPPTPAEVPEPPKPADTAQAAQINMADLRQDEKKPEPKEKPAAPASGAGAGGATAASQIHEPSTQICNVEIKSHELPNNRYLHEPFRVIKIDEEALISSRKERVWDVDFFNKKFGNLDLTGHESFSQPAINLYRVEKHPTISTRLILYFFEAPHPYDLQFTSTERRQRFYELAMLQRRNSVLWCPSLVPANENDALVKVQGTTIERPTGKVLKVRGDVQFSVAKMPYEVIDLWFGCFSLQNKPLPRSQSVMAGFMPKALHEVYVIGITNVPSQYMGSTEISDYFLSYLGPGLFFVLTSTAATPQDKKREVNNVFIVICRRSFIVRISHLEAMDLNTLKKDGLGKSDFTAVGASLRINEATMGFILINATTKQMDSSTRSSAIRGIMSNFPFGDTTVDIGVRFDYLIVAGAFGYGNDFTAEDMLVKQMKAGNVLSDMLEENAPPNITSRPNPMRVLYAVRPRTCRLDVKYYQSTRALDNPNVYCNMDVFCQRSYLATFGKKVPRTRMVFDNFTVAGHRIPHVNHPEILLTADWIDGAPIRFPLTYSQDTFSVKGSSIPQVIPVVHNTDFLRLQHVDFSLMGILPSAKDKKKMVVASGTVSLKNVATLGEVVEFTIPMYYRGCNVGALQADVLLYYNECVPAEAEAAGVKVSNSTTPYLHLVQCSENQVLNPSGTWVPANVADDLAQPWSHATILQEPRKREDFKLPDETHWKWITQWTHDSRPDDSEGWGYGLCMQNAVEMKKKKDYKFRRRRWTRVMQAPDAITLHSYLKDLHERASQ